MWSSGYTAVRSRRARGEEQPLTSEPHLLHERNITREANAVGEE